MVLIGTMMMLSVPLRRLLKQRGFGSANRGLALSAAGWGLVAGGTTGAGVMLLSMLMAAGLQGAAVIATDAVVSIGDRFRQGVGVRLRRRDRTPRSWRSRC